MDQEAVSHSLIGAVLRDEREAQKLSVEEVCSRLRLRSTNQCLRV